MGFYSATGLIPSRPVKTKRPDSSTDSEPPQSDESRVIVSSRNAERGREEAVPERGEEDGAASADSIRNLVLAVLCAVLGMPIAAVAFGWAGMEAIVAVFTALPLGAVIALGFQTRLVRQRNGAFLVCALCFLLTVSIPVTLRLAFKGAELVNVFTELGRQSKAAEVGAQSRVEAGGAVRSSKGEPAGESLAKSAPASGRTQGADVPQRTPAREPEPEPPAQRSREAQSTAGLPSLPPVAAEKVPDKNQPAPSVSEDRPDEDPVQKATRLSKEEAVRRYPALTAIGSPQHAHYIEAYNELARLRKFDFFKDPQWPLKLAEIVAQREGWKRSDIPGEGAPQTPQGSPAAAVPATQAVSTQTAPPQVASTSEGGKPKAALPGEELALDGPQSEVPTDPKELATNRAIIEVRRRYPFLGQNGSPENQIYLDAYNELKRLRPDFFESPEWPIRLAEIVAKREGWKRQDAKPSGQPAVPSVEPPLPK